MNSTNPFFKRISPFLFPISLGVLSYISKILTLSLVTFIVLASKSRFAQISEVVKDHQITSSALAALIIVSVLMVSKPLSQTKIYDLFPKDFLSKSPYYLLSGVTLGLIFILTLVFFKQLNYWGVLVRPEEYLEFFVSLLFRFFILSSFLFCEEFILREKFLSPLKIQVQKKPHPFAWSTLIMVTVALSQVLIRSIQFDLSFIEAGSLFLMSIALSSFFLRVGSFFPGALFLIGFYSFSHIIASAPFFGSEYAGVFIIKPQYLISRLSGGAGGPLSSAVFLAITLFFALRFYLNLWFKKAL